MTAFSSDDRLARPSANLTGSRKCDAQYRGSVVCSSVTHAPLTPETYGIEVELKLICFTTSINGSTTGSIIEEWKACEVCNRRAITPRSFSDFSSFSMAGVGPDTTHNAGLLTAAIEISADK